MSQIQSSFDARSRFVILWALAETWYPALVALATAWVISGGNFIVLTVLSLLSAPIAALCQLPLLRGRVHQSWLWVLAGIGSAILFQLLFTVIFTRFAGGVFPQQGGGLSEWLPYFLLSGAMAGVAMGLPQSVAMAQWKLGAMGWFFVVLGASLIVSAIGGVVWVMSGAGGATGEPPPPWAAALSAAVRQVAFGAITGVYLWQRLAQRSVDAAPRVP
jgi:hypothetical protein